MIWEQVHLLCQMTGVTEESFFFVFLQETETCWQVPDPTSSSPTVRVRVTSGWRALTRESGSRSQVLTPVSFIGTSSYVPVVVFWSLKIHPWWRDPSCPTCRRLWSESGGDCVVRATLRHATGSSGGGPVCHIYTGARDAWSRPVPPARSGHFG